MKMYNKLVRDKIPEIIKKSSRKPIIEKLNQYDYVQALKVKLNEEVNEYLKVDNDKNAIEELADILEVIYSLAEIHNTTKDELELVRLLKEEKCGGFKDGIFLIKVISDEE